MGRGPRRGGVLGGGGDALLLLAEVVVVVDQKLTDAKVVRPIADDGSRHLLELASGAQIEYDMVRAKMD